MSTIPSFVIFDVAYSYAISTDRGCVASCFIYCAAYSLVHLTITPVAGTGPTSGTLHLMQAGDSLHISSADYQSLLDCMAQRSSTDCLRLKLYYDPALSLDPNVIVVNRMETLIEPSTFAITKQLMTLNHSSDAIADNTKRMATDLSGAVLQELKGLHQRTNDIADLIRKGVGLLGMLAPPEGDRRPPLGGKNANPPKGD